MKLKVILKKIYFASRRFVMCLLPIQMKKQDFEPSEVKSILAIRIDRIGDVIVSIPALKALRLVFPKSKISVLVRKGNDALIINLPWVNEVICYQGFLKSVKLLRQRKFDLAVDLLMDYPLKTALLAYLSGVKFSAGFDLGGRGRFFNLALIPSSEKKQVTKHMLDLIRLIGEVAHIDEGSIQESAPELFASEQDKALAKEFLSNNGVKKGDILFGLHPGGHFPSQCWMPDRFAQTADEIIEKYKAKVIIVGSSREEKLIERVINLMRQRGAIKAIGFSLDNLAAIISLTALFICNNSGPLHIACALNIPTVSMMGPTDPILWWPVGRDHIVIRKNLPCSPCERAICKRHDCMQLITVDEVMKVIESQMEKISKTKYADITR